MRSARLARALSHQSGLPGWRLVAKGSRRQPVLGEMELFFHVSHGDFWDIQILVLGLVGYSWIGRRCIWKHCIMCLKVLWCLKVLRHFRSRHFCDLSVLMLKTDRHVGSMYKVKQFFKSGFGSWIHRYSWFLQSTLLLICLYIYTCMQYIFCMWKESICALKCCNVRLIYEWLRWGYVCRMKHRERSSEGRLGLKVYFSQLEKCKTHTWPETSMKRCFMCGVTVMSRIVRPYSMTTTVLDLLLSQLARFIEENLEVGPCTQPPQVDHLNGGLILKRENCKEKLIHDISLLIQLYDI